MRMNDIAEIEEDIRIKYSEERSPGLNIGRVARLAKEQLAEYTGLKPMSITRLNRDEEGWHVSLEMLEMARIPAISDLLGDYELTLSHDGNLVGFERIRTRLRGEPTDEREEV